MDAALADLMRRTSSPAWFAALSPLPIGGITISLDASLDQGPDEMHHPRPADPFPPSGYVVREAALEAARASEVNDVICRLVAHGMPAVFAFVYDALWEAVAAIGPHVRRVVPGARAIADVWAFHVPCGAAHRGWAPHRGVTTATRRGNEPPALLNTWLSLSEATRANGCMFVVPLDRDPHYPRALETLPDRALAEASAVALEVPPGSLLLWDANVAHWGGASSDGATVPRTSLSISWVEPHAGVSLGLASPLLACAPSSFDARIDLIAAMIGVYGDAADDVSDTVRAWARASLQIAADARGFNGAR
jgi:ectoine hydroxylase-related dioxygenase (phytanoyl-CoA dioxygenase family)